MSEPAGALQRRALALVAALALAGALVAPPARAVTLPAPARRDAPPALAAPAGFGAAVPRGALFRRLVEDSALASRLMDRGQLDSARACFAPYVIAARARGDEGLLARGLVLDAGLLIRQGRPDEALPMTLEAERHASAARDTGTRMLAMRAEAMVRNLKGDYAAAERLARGWMALAERVDSEEYRAWGHTMLGWLRMQRDGDFAGGERELREGVRRFERIDVPVGLAYTLSELARTVRARGDYAGAKALFQRALEVGERHQLPRVVALVSDNLAALEVITGDPGRAVPLYLRALEFETTSGSANSSVVTMDNLIELYLRLGRIDEAGALAERAVALARERGLTTEVPWQRGYRANVLEKAGRLDAARAEYAAVALDPGEIDAEARALAVMGLARVQEARDSLAAAVVTLQRGAAALGARVDADTHTELELSRGRLLAAAGRPAEALRVAEPLAATLERAGDRGRAFVAWTQIASARRALGDVAGTEAAIAHATALWEGDRRRVSDLEMRELRGEQAHALMTTAILSALASAPPAERAALAFERLQRFKTRTLLERMAGPAAFDSAGPAWLQAPLTPLASFQRDVLRPGELLLEYVASDDTLLVFAVTPEACRIAGAPGLRRIGPALALAHDVLAAGPGRPADAAAARGALERLGVLLLEPVRDELAHARHVMVAADGPLQRLPFAALTPPGGDGPLGGARGVAMVPSATLLRTMRERSSDGGERVLAVLGAPHRDHARLRGAEREVEALAAGFRDVVVWRGDAARAAPLTAASLAGYRVVHFAGHAEADDQLPWRSGLHLGTAGGGADSMLAAIDIATSRLGSPLVVLSGCESAGGRARSGEGVAGLTSAFLAAGAKTVVATLWPVDDATTARLMARFYDELARGRTTGEALAAAQRWTREQPATAHPFHWAGFVLIGDADRTVALRRRDDLARALLPALIGALAAALAALAWRWRPRPAPAREPA